jgi:hypothetical protein
MNRDPVTGRPLPTDAMQRVLYITPEVHIYRIPPITSTKGFNAASWTTNPADKIFTSRMRLVETAIPSSKPDGKEQVSAAILLEDGKSGELFAAAPYNHPSVVEQASDSSRFFALRVVGEGGRKATLGLGFEQRPDAFDFGVALQDVRRVLGLDSAPQAGGRPSAGGAAGSRSNAVPAVEEPKRDLSLKEGEMITINFGGRPKKATLPTAGEASFTLPLPPPPAPPGSISGAGGLMPILAPPPSAAASRADRKRRSHDFSAPEKTEASAEELGFDDGEFGEFQ